MKVQKKGEQGQAAWYSTVEIFGELSPEPQPEIQITPLSRKEKKALIRQATEIKMIPHPGKKREFLQAEVFDKFLFEESVLYTCITGLRHFERPDGTSLNAEPKDIDYLLETLGEEFCEWLGTLVTTVVAGMEQHEEDVEKNS